MPYGIPRGRALDLFRALASLAMLAGCATGGDPGTLAVNPVSAHYRVYDARNERLIDLESLSGALREVDVVLFGELHDDSVAHRVQAALFERLSRGRAGVLGMEMFERDVQRIVDRHVEGSIGEEDFRELARAWPNYESDYRPLVEIARQRGWDVAATNLPQRHASAIAREGLQALDALDADERRSVAEVIQCPEDAYWTRFLEAMFEEADSAANAAAHTIDEEVLRRTYLAQCARDETMAETIVTRLDDGPVFHVNGSFHSDHRLGIVPRVLRRAPRTTIGVITAIPVADLASRTVGELPIEENRDRADYLVFTAE